jgi:hypothetical protein
MSRTHGLAATYKAGCRCDQCRASVRNPAGDRDLLTDILREICPNGLTDDCPARTHEGQSRA